MVSRSELSPEASERERSIVDLTWSGGGSLNDVVIWRSLNGGAFVNILTTANDFSQRDETGLKGGQTLTYEVRSPNGSIKSNQQTISF